MVEIGTTNKTKITDYEKALKENKDSLILKVHRSNFSIDGFVEEVNLKDLKSLTKSQNSILIHDLGSGLVASKKFLEKENIDISDDEPTVQESLEQGADLVMFSGDKLFGSLQSGIIAGDKKMIQSIKESPLFRTYRCSPLTLFELQETTNRYVSKKEIERVKKGKSFIRIKPSDACTDEIMSLITNSFSNKISIDLILI